MARPRLPHDEIRAAAAAGKSVKEICIDFKCGGTAVTRILGRNGIGRGRPRLFPPKLKGEPSEKKIRKSNFTEFNRRRAAERLHKD